MERMFALALIALIAGLLAGLAAGAAVVSARLRGEAAAVGAEVAATRHVATTATQERDAARAELREAQDRAAALAAQLARLEAALDHERRSATEKLAVLDAAQQKLTDAFSALSADALDRNNRSFLELAKTALEGAKAEASGELEQRRLAVEHMVQPLQESLARVDAKLQGLEVARQEAYAGLAQQVRSLGETQERLRTETANLVTALRAPSVRGRWGELQLRRVVELAGMVRHCDFSEQVTTSTDDGRQRPDLVVHLPGGKHVVVDAKVPLEAYLVAAEAADDSTRTQRLRDHARQLRTHVDQLAAKAYWAQFDTSPDFVVLFIPGEPFLAAACEHDPGLFEHASAQRVMLATPTTLIALLQSVAYGWRQEALAENARAVCEVGRELYKRLATMGEHVSSVGKALDRAVDAYNKQVGSLESRVLVSARRLASLEIGEGDVVSPDPVEKSTRALQSPELTRILAFNEEVA